MTEEIWDKYEIDGRTFESQYARRCALDPEHKIKRGDRVSRLTLKDNPFVPVPGVACKNCTADLR